MVSGFAHASITKGLLIVTTISTVVLSVFQLKPYTHLQLVPHISVHAQYWRLATHHVAFANGAELFLATLLFYNVSREVERRLGSHKFASFLAVTTALYTALLAVLLLLFISISDVWPIRVLLPSPLRLEGRTPSGPFAPLFFVLYQHARIVPDRWTVRLGPLYLGDRSIQIWSLSLLLFLSQPSLTPFACTLAVATSALYRSDMLLSSSLKSYRIPLRMYTALSFLFSGMIGSTMTPTRSWRAEPPAPPSYETRRARREQMQIAMDGARNERARRMTAVMRSVGRLRMRFGTNVSAPSDGGSILPTTSRDAATTTATTTEERTRTDEVIRELLQAALRVREDDGQQASNAPDGPLRNYAPPSSSSPREGGGAGTAAGLRELLTQITAPTDPSTAITETSVQALQAMFPHLPRATLVEALQMSNGSQPDALERLLVVAPTT